MLNTLRAALRWAAALAAALLAPAFAALASAILYFAIYGARAEPAFVVQLYAAFFVVLNLVLAPALRRGEREGDVALWMILASAAGLGALLAARLVFPAWPPAPVTRDLLFVAGAALGAAIAWWFASLVA